ncbi:MAG TPA: carboxypeptidase-like regulatory domain-containing protein [Chthonomonadaceae bacterium]|nr:carboxypeptidase-like regulatory domain-containing protein [Chthonomonadaceae bacterium]
MWQSPHVRASLSALIAVLAIALIVGCGGGGGNSNNNNNGNNGSNGSNNGGLPPGQNPGLPFITGKVVGSANTAIGVPGATVTIHGAGLADRSVQTAADGSFTFINVARGYTSFSVASPDPVAFYNFANFNGKNYDTVNCTLPLPGLAVGANNVGTVILSSGGNNPPPPPPISGCPS